MGKFTDKEIAEQFDRLSKIYNLVLFPIEIFFFRRLRKKILKEARGNVLEVGVGTGANLPYYRKESKISATDISPKMLEIAKRRADKLGLDVDFYLNSAEELPFNNKRFDFVIDTLGLCTFQNSISALKEMARVCKKNGRIVLLEHGASSNSFLYRLQCYRERRRSKSFACSLIRNHETLVRKAGLKIEKIERHLFGIFYVIIARKKLND